MRSTQRFEVSRGKTTRRSHDDFHPTTEQVPLLGSPFTNRRNRAAQLAKFQAVQPPALIDSTEVLIDRTVQIGSLSCYLEQSTLSKNGYAVVERLNAAQSWGSCLGEDEGLPTVASEGRKSVIVFVHFFPCTPISSLRIFCKGPSDSR